MICKPILEIAKSHWTKLPWKQGSNNNNCAAFAFVFHSPHTNTKCSTSGKRQTPILRDPQWVAGSTIWFKFIKHIFGAPLEGCIPIMWWEYLLFFATESLVASSWKPEERPLWVTTLKVKLNVHYQCAIKPSSLPNESRYFRGSDQLWPSALIASATSQAWSLPTPENTLLWVITN